MIVTPAGAFENAIFRALTVQSDPTRIRPGHPYYDSLYRVTSRTHFDRCATFIAVADELLLLPADWAIPSYSSSKPITLEQFGIRFSTEWEYERNAEDFAALLLLRKAFSPEALAALKRGVSPRAIKRRTARRQIRGLGKVDNFALQHLCRLLGQVQLARAAKTKLLLGDEERLVLSEISKFALQTKIPTPFDLPDLDSAALIDAETFAGGLLNFSPPDALAAAAVRKDATISTYAAKVRDLLSAPSTLDTQRELARAMRAALKRSDTARRIETVFEVESFVCKPLHYIPALGEVLTVFEDGLELGKKWVQRKRSADEWFLLGPKMSEISIRDYLRRTGNL
jgi:hypothetical protein